MASDEQSSPTGKKETEREKKYRRKGRIIRVSQEVYAYLERKKQGTISWDSLFRKIFGLPNRKGLKQPLTEFYFVPSTGRAFQKLSEARGAAIVDAVRKGSRKPDKPIRMREVV